MSNKKRKIRKKPQRAPRPRRSISPDQNMRFQRANQALSAGSLAMAESEYRALISEKVKVPDLFCRLAAICAQTGRSKEAMTLWKQALALEPRHIEANMNLAAAYQQSGDIDRSINVYRRVIAGHKEVFVAKYLLANLLKAQGKFEQAVSLYQQVMDSHPDYTQAHYSYAQLHRYEDSTDPHIEVMLKLNQNPHLKEENRIHLAFALAKAFENSGDYSRAFEHLETGNELRKKAFNYNVEGDAALIQSIIRHFSAEAMSSVRPRPETSKRPIFILGMPRSGTSLVEKIISSHSDVYGAGELEYIFSLGTRLFLKQSAEFQFKPLDIYALSSFETFARSYLESIQQLDSKAAHVTDKMPFNMMMIGLIRMVLPNAKIIHCVRDARDVCLSIYKQNFTTGNYRFAYDLKHIGQFYHQYQALMEHWHQVMPGVIYDVDYEKLTHNPEQEIRQLVAACDLDWQDQCLAFDKAEGLVRTASAFQARQPMYKSSVNLWEKYQPNLQPLLNELNNRS